MRIRTPKDVGAAIREKRRALGLDQRSLAKRVDVSRKWVIEIEKGKPRAAMRLVLRTLDALGCLDQWLRDDPDNVRALMLKGNLFWQVKAPLKAIPEYRRVLELDAGQLEARWRLARCLNEPAVQAWSHQTRAFSVRNV